MVCLRETNAIPGNTNGNITQSKPHHRGLTRYRYQRQHWIVSLHAVIVNLLNISVNIATIFRNPQVTPRVTPLQSYMAIMDKL
jgi:hypothetical protein